MKKLSKLLIALLALTMVFAGVVGFAACGPDTPPPDDGGGTDLPDPEPEVHTCEHKCVVCGLCLDLDCAEPECAEKCGDQENRTLYDFEGEDEHVELRGGDLGALGIAKEEEFGATETYIGNFNANPGAAIKYTVTAEKAGRANLIVSVCKRQVATIFTNVVATLVNGEMLDSPSRVPANGKTTDTWTEFEDVNLGCVELKEGRNTIDFAIMDANVGSGYNFNAMRLKSEMPVTWYEGPHICDTVCPDCGKCKDYACPDPACADKCEEGWTEYVFSAMDKKVELGGGAVKNTDAGYVGGMNGPECVGASVTFNVTVEASTYASINLESCHRPTAVNFNDAFRLTVNSNNVASSAAMPTGGEEWNEFRYTKIGYAKLKKGKNTIKIELISDDPGKGANIRGIKLGTPTTPVDWYVFESAVNYKFEAENADSNGWDKLSKAPNAAASGEMCVGGVYDVSLSDPGKYYLSFDVYAAADTEATLYIGVSAAEAINAKAFPITVNDEDKTVDKAIPKSGWDEFQEVEYNVVSLKKGKNTIRMTIAEAAIGNIDFIGFAAQVELTGAPEA